MPYFFNLFSSSIATSPKVPEATQEEKDDATISLAVPDDTRCCFKLFPFWKSHLEGMPPAAERKATLLAIKNANNNVSNHINQMDSITIGVLATAGFLTSVIQVIQVGVNKGAVTDENSGNTFNIAMSSVNLGIVALSIIIATIAKQKRDIAVLVQKDTQVSIDILTKRMARSNH